jgi:hypothetical protein
MLPSSLDGVGAHRSVTAFGVEPLSWSGLAGIEQLEQV